MRLTDKIIRATAEDRPYWSFEYFPPKTAQGLDNLYERLERMYRLGPEFIDVTWGAGGSTSNLTLEICTDAQTVHGLETCMHLTCTNITTEEIRRALDVAKEAGIQNILALRGDPPRGQDAWTATEDGFAHAVDLVRFIRREYGDHFCVGVAAYPEGHTENPDPEEDLRYLKEKVDAGADYIVTQLFYDTDLFLRWYRRCRDLGISIPILPGIMPIQSYGGFRRMVAMCNVHIPPAIDAALAPIHEDDQAVKDYGVELAVSMCRALLAAGIRGYHFYTLNLERSTRRILEDLAFIAPIDRAKPLPWNPSLGPGRAQETVRPIFWRNRPKSYISRTDAWDDFPNGRWGDARSPAYGDFQRFAGPTRLTPTEADRLWGSPTSPDAITSVFTRYCEGHVPSLPWSEQPLDEQAQELRPALAHINAQGYLTINSQPSVNGARSDDPIYGWGPKHGYVYQKAYLEFFTSPPLLDALLRRLERHPLITYYAVNRHGDLRTNSTTDGPCALTWGVFPGKEVVQPTIIDSISFLAWKDEAYAIWAEWAAAHPPTSPTAAAITAYADECFLVNLVHNDFHVKDALYEVFSQ